MVKSSTLQLITHQSNIPSERTVEFLSRQEDQCLLEGKGRAQRSRSSSEKMLQEQPVNHNVMKWKNEESSNELHV
jgi:hypothetical protein